jgi:hypothetical protein
MAQTTLRQRVYGNPGRRKKRGNYGARKHRKARKNPDILGFVLSPMAGNPGRKRGSMARRKANRGTRRRKSSVRRRRNPGMKMARRNRSYGGVTHRRRRRKNPGVRRHHRHFRRNPGMGGIGPDITNAIFVIVGALGSKLGAQAVLGANNVGVVGYAGNAAVGAILWFLTEKVMKNRDAAKGVIAGTLVQIILRVINDYTPLGSLVSQLGLGDYQAQAFVTPQVLANPMQNATIAIPAGWGAAPPMPSATAGSGQMMSKSGSPGTGMSGLYGGSWKGLYGR